MNQIYLFLYFILQTVLYWSSSWLHVYVQCLGIIQGHLPAFIQMFLSLRNTKIMRLSLCLSLFPLLFLYLSQCIHHILFWTGSVSHPFLSVYLRQKEQGQWQWGVLFITRVCTPPRLSHCFYSLNLSVSLLSSHQMCTSGHQGIGWYQLSPLVKKRNGLHQKIGARQMSNVTLTKMHLLLLSVWLVKNISISLTSQTFFYCQPEKSFFLCFQYKI